MIRLAFVIPALDQSGAERQLTLLATGLPREEYQVHVFALNHGGYFEQTLRDAAIPCTIIGKCCRFDPRAPWRLRQALRKFSPHLIQSFLFAANTCVRLPGVAPLRDTPLIISERCVDTWKTPWQLACDRLLAPRAAAVTANSESVSSFYRSLGVPAERLHVIPNAITPPAQPQDRTAARRQLQLSDHEFVIGFAGRLAPQKRLRDLIWAFHMLQLTHADLRLTLLGDGPQRSAMQEFAEHLGCADRVSFCGHQPAAAALCAAFDCFVLPSDFEGMSNSLMEAMLAGLPCIVSDIPANRELVQHEQTGLTYPVGDSLQLARAIQRVRDTPTLAAELARNATSFITSHCSYEQMLHSHQRLYAELLRH